MPRLWDLTTSIGKARLTAIMVREFGQFDWNPERFHPPKKVGVVAVPEDLAEIDRIMRQPPASHNELRG